jgi:transcriptional regulator with XRE-family HTH domain
MQEFAGLLVELGNSIRTKRKALDWSQRELAERTGLHRTYVADVERGTRNVSIVNVFRLARALRVTVSELCQGMENGLEIKPK